MVQPHLARPVGGGLTLHLEHGALTEIAERVLPGSGRLRVTRAEGGVSTPVFRIERDGVTFYLRIAESADVSLAPEVLAHELMRARGVRVPEVVLFDPIHAILGRSVMVTTAIPGGPLCDMTEDADVTVVLRAAGRELALINSIPVDGFGWIRRDRAEPGSLEAQHSSLRHFALDDLETQLSALKTILSIREIDAICLTIDRCDDWTEGEEAFLAHGDFDTTHIFRHHGYCSGIIDFGEIRGADPYYDLGHFALHDGERVPNPLLAHLIAGYRKVAPLSPDAERRIQLWSLLIGMRTLARVINRPRSAYRQHLQMAVRRALRELQNV